MGVAFVEGRTRRRRRWRWCDGRKARFAADV